jgi:radical SAM superfamily enzyme YgiQ (UPF0313 family)
MAYNKTFKILLINPVTKRYFWGNSYFPSLGLPLMAAYTPENIEVSIIDEAQSALDLDKLPDADLIGISTLTASAGRAYEIADAYRRIGKKVVMGGIHASSLPEEALTHADSVVVGEGDNLWSKVIADFEKENLKKIYSALGNPPTMQETPMPSWHLVEKGARDRNMQIVLPVQAGRGCPNKCNFCNVPEMFGRAYRTRNISDVIDEIATVKEKMFLLIDDNLLASVKFAKALLAQMVPLKKEWMGLASLAHLNDDEILKALSDAGCRYLFIGFETTNPQNIQKINKSVNKISQYSEIINKIHSYGMKVIGSFIVGLDHDDDSVFEDIYTFIDQNDIYVPIVNILTPYPGTELFLSLKEQNRIISYDWSRYSCDEVVYLPRNMSAETLQLRHHELVKALSGRAKNKFSGRQKKDYSLYDF